MIPIRYRMDKNDELGYIQEIEKIIDINNIKAYSQDIENLIDLFEKKGFSRCKELRDKADEFIGKYKDYKYFCMWLVLTFEQIDEMVTFIRDNYIEPDLKNINSSLSKKYKRIKNYVDLLTRRTRGYNDKSIMSLVNGKIGYDHMHTSFKNFIKIYDEYFSKNEVNVWIIEKTGVKVCPYCNLSYAYNRGNRTTAQLDHFFCKAEYPMFDMCFYNLIPCCPACNRIKSAKTEKMSSPYEKNAFEDIKITWNFKKGKCKKRIYKKMIKTTKLKPLENSIEIDITSGKLEDRNNIKLMKLKEAYSQHRDIASEFIKKVQMCMNPQSRKLIDAMCSKWSLGPDEIEQFYFGEYLKKEEQEKRLLSKMSADFMEEYKKGIKK